MFKKKILKYGLIYSFLVSFFYLVYSNWNMNYFEYFELKTYDLRYKIRELFPSEKRNFDVVIIGIDEKSLIKIGKWPWNRSIHGQLLNTLEPYEIRSIGFDISFTEFGVDKTLLKVKENLKEIIGENYYSGNLNEELTIQLLEELNLLKTDEDYVFSEAIKNLNKVVIGTYNILSSDEKIDESIYENNDYLKFRYPLNDVFTEISKQQYSEGKSFKPFNVYKILPPIEVIGKNARGIAPFEVGFPDPDGILRGVALVTEEEYKKVYVPTLYLLTFLTAYNLTIEENTVLDIEKKSVNVTDKNGNIFRKIPTNKNGYQRLFYYGDRFNYYSYIDILEKKISRDNLKNKIILVGFTDTAKGLYDLRSTPLDPNIPGVEIHATAIQNLIDNKFMTRADLIPNIFFILFNNVILTFLLSLKNITVKKSNVLVIILILLSMIINFILFVNGKWYEFFYPLLTYFSSYLLLSIKNYFDEEVEKKYIRGVFSQYISPKLVEELIKKPEMLKLGGEKKELTCLFSDIEGFTSISEKMKPEELVELLNEYLSAMSSIIIDHNGTIDKYIGDAIMAIFGAPVNSQNSAKDACFSAINYQKKLRQIRNEKNIELHARIGINTGEMIVGNMGCSIGEIKRFDYTVIGDEVNLASRLESINKYYGTYIIISENTYEKVKDIFLVRIIDYVKVKGKSKPVMIFELIEEMEIADEKTKDFVREFEEALDFYRNRQWDNSKEIFEILFIKAGDKASKVYLERIENYKKIPPPLDWDYSYTFTTK